MNQLIKFEDGPTERMQLESEEFVSALSRMYVGHDVTYSKFVNELESAINKAYDDKLDINDLEYLAATCIALRRETILKCKRFI